MNYFFTILLSALTCFHYPDHMSAKGLFQVSVSDTSVQKIKSGFYFAIDDTSNAKGYRLRHSKQYFLLGTAPVITLDQIDTITKVFYEPIKRLMLDIKFNTAGAKAWLDFTQKYQGLKVAIVLNNEVIYVATIHEPIHSGIAFITVSTAREADDYKSLLEKEMATAKNKKGNS